MSLNKSYTCEFNGGISPIYIFDGIEGNMGGYCMRVRLYFHEPHKFWS